MTNVDLETGALEELEQRYLLLTGRAQGWVALCRGWRAGTGLLSSALEDNLAVLRSRVLGWPVADAARELGANRALAAATATFKLANALAGAEDAAAAVQQSAVYWRAARLQSAGLGATWNQAADRSSVAGVLELVDGLNADGVRAFMSLLVAHLAGGLPDDFRAVRVPVLYDRGLAGAVGTLALRRLKLGPAGLHPDPASSVFFAGDDRFVDAINTAWGPCELARDEASVLWSLMIDDEPTDEVRGGSLGGAFAVALDELKRASTVAGRLRSRPIDKRCAVSATLSADGRLGSVDGLRRKFEAASDEGLRVVTAGQSDDARRAIVERARDFHLDVRLAGDVADAVHQTRRTLGLSTRTAIVLTAVLLIAVPIGVVAILRSESSAQRAALSALAAHVAQEARDIAPGEANGTGLLLAMASDDLARAAGHQTRTFETLAQSVGSLVRILYGPTGGYVDETISPDGRWLLVASEVGLVRMVDTTTGAVAWQHTFSPGLDFSPGQVGATALAFSRTGRRAAIGTSDRGLIVLADGARGWHVGASDRLPVPLVRDSIGLNPNHATSLAFTADERAVYAYRDRIGLYQFASDRSGPATLRCPTLTGAVKVSAWGTAALLVFARAVQRVSSRGCTTTPVLAAPQATLVDAVQLSRDTVAAVGTVNGELEELLPDQPPRSITDIGPLENIKLIDSVQGLTVTASSPQGLYGWSLNPTALAFRFVGRGVASLAGDRIVLIQDGDAEVYTNGSDTFASVRVFHDAHAFRVAWAGAEDLVVAQFAGLYYVPLATTRGAPFSFRRLPVPRSIVQMVSVVGDAGARWVGAILVSRLGGRQVFVWGIRSRRVEAVPQRVGDGPSAMTFSGEDLYVGWRSGTLQRLIWDGSKWTVSHQVTLLGRILAIAGRGRDHLYALVAPSPSASPSVVAVDLSAEGMSESGRRDLSGGGPAGGLGALVQLTNGELIAAYGSGTAQFLTGALQLDGSPVASRVGLVTAAAAIPQADQVIVGGVLTSATLQASTHELLSTDTWGRAGTVSSASVSFSRDYVATVNALKGAVTVWTLDQSSLQRRACTAIGRTLTRAEWARYVGPGAPYRPVCPAEPTRQ